MADATPEKTTFKRVMLKISGEALMGDQGFGLHPPTVERIAREVKIVHDLGVEICMVIGGGNIFRGLQGSAQGMERTTADYMGMLATVQSQRARVVVRGGVGHRDGGAGGGFWEGCGLGGEFLPHFASIHRIDNIVTLPSHS